MQTEETKDEGEKAKSTDFGFPEMGQRMLEMMNKCCAGRGESPGCSVMMKKIMEAAKNQPCCGPKTEDTGYDRREK